MSDYTLEFFALGVGSFKLVFAQWHIKQDVSIDLTARSNTRASWWAAVHISYKHTACLGLIHLNSLQNKQ